MNDPMNDSEFEVLLGAAFTEPSDRPVQPQLIAGVLDRVERRRRMRRAVLGLATLAGCAVVALAILATGVTGLISRTLAELGPEPKIIDPSICLAVGFLLMVLAAVRNEVRGI